MAVRLRSGILTLTFMIGNACVFRWNSGFNEAAQSGGCTRDKKLHHLIKRYVDQSTELSKQKATKLHKATTEHIGLELMHQFVVDLLGSDTASAKIFIQKVYYY